MINVGLAAVCDFTSMPMGGELSLLNRLLSVDSREWGIRYKLIGISFEDERLGVWSTKSIGAISYDWLPIASGNTKLPLRLVARRGLNRYRAAIASADIDVFYIHSPELFEPLSRHGKKCVYHVHGDPYFTVRMSRFPMLRLAPFAAVYDRTIQNALEGSQRIIWAAERSMSEFLAKVPAAKKWISGKVEVIHSCFDPVYAEGRKELSAVPTCITVGRLAEIKHIDFLIDVFERINSFEPEARFFICGTGEEEHALKAMAKRKKCGGCITFTGRLDSSDLASYLKRSDVFLFASESEAMSLVVLESLAAGVPVVSTDVGDISKVIVLGSTGQIIPGRELDKFVDATLGLIRSRGSRQIEQACRNTAAEFTPGKMAERIAKVIDEMQVSTEHERLSDKKCV